jgi:hypothetical protein
MKKIIVLLALSFFALTGMAMAFNTKSIDPGKKVLKSFKKDFPNVTQVEWQTGKPDINIARFVQNERVQLAYYKGEGEHIGQVWAVENKNLPSKVMNKISDISRKSTIKSVLLFFPPKGYPSYFVTLEANGKTIVKKINSYGNLSNVKKNETIPVI